MSEHDEGIQSIGWKYKTPLKAEELSPILSGYATPGLLTRPMLTPTEQNVNAKVKLNITPFSVIIYPDDYQTLYYNNLYKDEDGNPIQRSVVKVTTRETISSIDLGETWKDCVAIGMKFSYYSNTSNVMTMTYADFIALKAEDVQSFNGIIIATVLKRAVGNDTKIAVTTSGADISSLLLEREGWNPECWPSLTSPRENANLYKNYDETEYTEDADRKKNLRIVLRDRYNKLYSASGSNSGYINTHLGLKQIENGIDKNYIPIDRKVFTSLRSAIVLDYNGMSLVKDIQLDTPCDGSIIALINASTAETEKSRLFANEIKLLPCKHENQNMYWTKSTKDGDELYTLTIR